MKMVNCIISMNFNSKKFLKKRANPSLRSCRLITVIHNLNSKQVNLSSFLSHCAKKVIFTKTFHVLFLISCRLLTKLTTSERTIPHILVFLYSTDNKSASWNSKILVQFVQILDSKVQKC